MNAIDPDESSASPLPRRQSSGLRRLIIVGIAVPVGLAALAAGLPWLVVMTPRWLVRGASITFLWALLGAYAVTAPSLVVVGAWSCVAVVRAARRHDRSSIRRYLRWLVLAMSCFVSLAAAELICALTLSQSYQIPDLTARSARPPERRALDLADAKSRAAGGEQGARTGSMPPAAPDLYLVVVGESSALGQPYDPWVSVGQIVGWQLEQVFPGRRITVDIRARGGFTLGQAVSLLANLARRPDAIIVFSGHNEIQTRFGYARNVRHYAEEGPESPLAWLELARSTSSTASLILDTLDNNYGEAPPPPGVTRELIDHPICTPKEYASTREGFRQWLDSLVSNCKKVGALPILIVPASNDGAFEPNRSVLRADTPPADRAAFERAFRAARALEATDPDRATGAFRQLVQQHPEFAESHYRLARLLADKGAWDEARLHFSAARDLDGSPPRCPTDFRQAIEAVARHQGAVLIDGPAILGRISPHGVLDDLLYHDAHHPNLVGIIALAQEILDQLKTRHVWGWPETMPVPAVKLGECAQHFGVDAHVLERLCERSADWYGKEALICHDPTARQAVAEQYNQAGRAIAAGLPIPPASPQSLRAVHAVLAAPKPRS